MTCKICGHKFRDNDKVVPVLRYTMNTKRGDFVRGFSNNEFVHLSCLEAS